MKARYLSLTALFLLTLNTSTQAQKCEGGNWCGGMCVDQNDVCCDNKYACQEGQSCCGGGCCPEGTNCDQNQWCSASADKENRIRPFAPKKGN